MLVYKSHKKLHPVSVRLLRDEEARDQMDLIEGNSCSFEGLL